MTKAQDRVAETKAAQPAGDTDQGQQGSEAFPQPSAQKIVEAREQGVLDAIQSSTAEAFKRGANEGYGDAPSGKRQIAIDANVLNIRDLLDLDVEALTARLDGSVQAHLSEGKVAGLLEMERSGKNRTDYVKALCKRLGVDSPYDVTAAGPAYTNDTSQTTKV